jgi:hypothetical protein
MYFARTAQKLREQMVRFSGELSAGHPKVVRLFVACVSSRENTRKNRLKIPMSPRVLFPSAFAA